MLGSEIDDFLFLCFWLEHFLEIHDEYWHPHVDRNNTPHYHYSGLLYLSTYDEDFTGGRFFFENANDYAAFENGQPLADNQENTDIGSDNTNSNSNDNPRKNIELVMEPRAGRIAIFSSGMENTHQVERVVSGQRFVLSFWFTCDPQREFEIFLDGSAHIAFGQKFKESMIRRAQQQNQAPQTKKSSSSSNQKQEL